MRREWIAFILVVPLLFLYVFYPEHNPVEKVKHDVTIHDDFFTLLGRQTSLWKSFVRETDLDGIERYRKVYEKNKNFQYASGPNFRIPKTVHVIWLGPNSFPRESVENIRTWVAHHPDWTFNFWTDRKRPAPVSSMMTRYVSDFSFLHLKNRYEEATNWAEKSDILRYEILYQNGGLYIDHDADCIRPFHGLHRGYDFYACLELPHAAVDNMSVTAGIGVIGAKPHHPILKGCIDSVEARWKDVSKDFAYNDPETQRELTLHRTYISLTHSLQQNLDLPGNHDIVFPSSYFYAKGPLPSLYSQHFYGGKWEKKSGNAESKLLTSLPSVLQDMKLSLRRLVKLLGFCVIILLSSVFVLVGMRKKVLVTIVLFPFFLGAKPHEFIHLMGEQQGYCEYVRTQEDQQNLDFFAEMYAKNKALLQSEVDRIPHKIHFVWFGPQSMPKESIKNVRTWIAHHPDWEFYLWTDRTRTMPHKAVKQKLVQDYMFEKLERPFYLAKSFREKADVMRYEILYSEGGLIVDHDVKCHRSFEQFNQSYDFFAGLHPLGRATLSSSVLVSNSVVGSKPHHPILRLCLALVSDKWPHVDAYFPGTDKESIIYRVFHRIFAPFDYAVKARANHGANRDVVFPVGYFNRVDNDFGIYAYHKYGVTWLDGVTKAERQLKERISSLSRKQEQLLYITLGIVVFAIFMLGTLLYFSKKLERN